MKIVMLLILSLSLTTISCSKKKGASAPTSDSGGTTPTAITYYASDSMTIKPSTINNPSGKTITSCTCSNVPTGMTCSSSSPCQLTGSPTGTSTYNTTITANYSDNTSSSKEYTISYSSGNPPAPTLSSPTATGLDTSGATPVLTGTKNSAINTISFPSDHVVSSCSYTGTLPTGLTVNNDCSISGTPTGTTPSSGNSITVTPTNSGGTSSTTQTVKIVVPAPPEITLNTSTSTDATSSSSTSVTLTSHSGSSTGLYFNVTDYPITSCSISPTSLPTGLIFNSATCEITGTPTASTTSTGTTYTITPSGAAGAMSPAMNVTVKVYTKWCDGHTDTGSASNGKKGGTGASTDPFIICGKDGIKFVKNTTTNDYPTVYYYKLQSDVNFANSYLPIGTTSEKFNGVFDGAGYTISNQLNSDIAGGVYGMFTYTNGSAEIKNFILDNSSLSVPGLVGGIVGNVVSGTTKISNIIISNSKVAASSSTDAGNFVGLVSSGASLEMNKILIHSAQASSGNNTSVFVGSSSGTISYTDAIYDSAMTTYLAQSGSPSGISSFSLPILKSDSTVTTYGGIVGDSEWDLSRVKAIGGNTPLLVKHTEQKYSDTTIKP